MMGGWNRAPPRRSPAWRSPPSGGIGPRSCSWSNVRRPTSGGSAPTCGGRDHADDLTQETYSRAIASLHRFRGESDVRSWLLTIARRVCADQVRAEIRRRNLLGRLRPVPETHEPSTSVELWGVIGSLHGERREAFVLTQVLGLSYEEAAQVCSCPIGTIRSRVARARCRADQPDGRSAGAGRGALGRAVGLTNTDATTATPPASATATRQRCGVPDQPARGQGGGTRRGARTRSPPRSPRAATGSQRAATCGQPAPFVPCAGAAG